MWKLWNPGLTKALLHQSKLCGDRRSPQEPKVYEFVLTDTDSVEIDHIFEENNPDSIQYSKFTIKRILSPFEWFVDHLHTPIHLSKAHRSQTYNWYDYKATWYNFIFVRPNIHTWL